MTTQRRRQATTRRISDQWLQYIRGGQTMTAANTFTELSVALPVVVAEGFVIEAHLIEFDIPLPLVADLGETDDTATITCQLTKASQSQLIQMDDADYIYGMRRTYLTPNARTSEQAPVFAADSMGSMNWQFPEPILLPFTTISFGMDTDGVAFPPRFRFRIGYKTIRLTTRQLPELIQAVT